MVTKKATTRSFGRSRECFLVTILMPTPLLLGLKLTPGMRFGDHFGISSSTAANIHASEAG